MVVYLFLVPVKDLVVGRFPLSSATKSVLNHGRWEEHIATYLTYQNARTIKHKPMKPPMTTPMITPKFLPFGGLEVLFPVSSTKAVVGTYTWDGLGVIVVRTIVVVT